MPTINQINLRRLAIRYGITVLVVAISILILRSLTEEGLIGASLRQVAIVPYVLAAGTYYASFFVRRTRWVMLLQDAEVKGPYEWATGFIVINWFINTTLPAKLGDIHRSLLAARNYETGEARALGTIATERALDLFVLVVGLTAAMLLVLPEITGVSFRLIALALGVVVSVGVAILVISSATRLDLPLPDSINDLLTDFNRGLLTFTSARRFLGVVALSVLIWTFDVARIGFVALALGVGLDIPVLVLIAFLIAFLSGLPYTPAGLGVVEVVTASVLIQTGLSGDLGVAFILFDRLITVGSLVVIGGIVYLYFKYVSDVEKLGT